MQARLCHATSENRPVADFGRCVRRAPVCISRIEFSDNNGGMPVPWSLRSRTTTAAPASTAGLTNAVRRRLGPTNDGQGAVREEVAFDLWGGRGPVGRMLPINAINDSVNACDAIPHV